jgi:hypothetical protein
MVVGRHGEMKLDSIRRPGQWVRTVCEYEGGTREFIPSKMAYIDPSRLICAAFAQSMEAKQERRIKAS